MRKKLMKLLEKRWAANTFAICSGVVLFVLLTKIRTAFNIVGYVYNLFVPVIIGAVIAYIINPLVVYFENLFKKGNPDKNYRSIATIVSLLLVVVFIVVFIIILIPSIASSFSSLFSNINSYVRNADAFIENIERFAMNFGIDLTELGDSLSRSLSEILNNLPSYVAAIVAKSYQLGAGIINYIIGGFIAVYFLLGKESIIATINRFRKAIYSESFYHRSNSFWHKCNDILSRYIWCTILEAIIIGAVNAMFMMAFGLPYVPLLSIVVGVFNMLPTVGPIIGGAIGGFILVLNKPIQALIFIIFTIILQTIDGYIIKPKLFGDSLGVPAVMILISIVVGGKIFGVLGILVAIPVAGIITFLYTEIIFPRLENRRKPVSGEEVIE